MDVQLSDSAPRKTGRVYGCEEWSVGAVSNAVVGAMTASAFACRIFCGVATNLCCTLVYFIVGGFEASTSVRANFFHVA